MDRTWRHDDDGGGEKKKACEGTYLSWDIDTLMLMIPEQFQWQRSPCSIHSGRQVGISFVVFSLLVGLSLCMHVRMTAAGITSSDRLLCIFVFSQEKSDGTGHVSWRLLCLYVFRSVPSTFGVYRCIRTGWVFPSALETSSSAEETRELPSQHSLYRTWQCRCLYLRVCGSPNFEKAAVWCVYRGSLVTNAAPASLERSYLHTLKIKGGLMILSNGTVRVVRPAECFIDQSVSGQVVIVSFSPDSQSVCGGWH